MVVFKDECNIISVHEAGGNMFKMKTSDLKSKATVICILYTASYSVNKYVLSELKFQYPTIFQGWQTFFGLILLTMLYRIGSVDIDVSQINSKNVIHWSPYIGSFVIVIYSGSVALSQLQVPVFMSLHNNLAIFQMLLERFIINNKLISIKEYCVTTVVLISSLFIINTAELENRRPYLWMVLHLIASAFTTFYPKLNHTLPAVSKTCRLYMCYLSSMLILLPSTFLLGDAMAAKNFAFWYYYKFYIGCVLSGIFGVYLNLSLVDLTDRSQAYNYTLPTDITGLAKLCASLVSLIFFPIPLASSNLAWCLINLVAGTQVTGTDDSEGKTSIEVPELKRSDFMHV